MLGRTSSKNHKRSAGGSRIASRSDFIRNRKKRALGRHVLRSASIVGGFGVIIGVLVFLVSLPTVRFTEINVEGVRTIPQEDITQVAWVLLAEKRFWIFPRSSMFIFDPDDFTSDIHAEFPKLGAAEIDRDFKKNVIHIHVDERDVWMIYCREDMQCFKMSSDGRIYENSSLSGELITKIYDHRKEQFQVGSVPLDKGLQVFIDTFDVSLRKMEISGLKFLLEETQDIRIETGEGWYIIADSHADPVLTIENLTLTLNEQIKDKRSSLEYIDLRYGDRLFYKYRD